jgi:mycothiol synthase
VIGPRRIIAGIGRRIVWVVKGKPAAPPAALEMLWPPQKRERPEISIAAGYRMRQYTAADRKGYDALLLAADMGACPLDYWEKHHLPDGFFVIEHEGTGQLVAACFASHHPTERHPRAGNFGWLAAHPDHRGKGLGRAVSAAVTRRLIEAGYRRIYLETHDFRKPAIAVYLNMGWVPYLFQPDMAARWQAVCRELNWPYQPDTWHTAALSKAP